VNFKNAHKFNFALNTQPIVSGQQARPAPVDAAHSRAEIYRFRTPLPKVLEGEYLRAVSAIEHSLCRQGLMTPLVVSLTPAAQAGAQRAEQKLIVIDGQKRLMALRKLRFKGRLPASLMRVPYVYANMSQHRTGHDNRWVGPQAQSAHPDCQLPAKTVAA
jgi:hypothetical protein